MGIGACPPAGPRGRTFEPVRQICGERPPGGTAARAGRAQSSSLYNLGYYGGSSLFGWLGGVFLAEHGWTGTVLMTVGLAVIAGVLALVLLHVAGALKHQFVDRERELARMGIGRVRRGT